MAQVIGRLRYHQRRESRDAGHTNRVAGRAIRVLRRVEDVAGEAT